MLDGQYLVVSTVSPTRSKVHDQPQMVILDSADAVRMMRAAKPPIRNYLTRIYEFSEISNKNTDRRGMGPVDFRDLVSNGTLKGDVVKGEFEKLDTLKSLGLLNYWKSRDTVLVDLTRLGYLVGIELHAENLAGQLRK